MTALTELELAAPQDAGCYQMCLQTGNETLDDRIAQQYYWAFPLRIQVDSDHGYQWFTWQFSGFLGFADNGADQYQSFDFLAL